MCNKHLKQLAQEAAKHKINEANLMAEIAVAERINNIFKPIKGNNEVKNEKN